MDEIGMNNLKRPLELKKEVAMGMLELVLQLNPVDIAEVYYRTMPDGHTISRLVIDGKEEMAVDVDPVNSSIHFISGSDSQYRKALMDHLYGPGILPKGE